MKEHWLSTPEEHDYAAAVAYLSLLMPPVAAQQLGTSLSTCVETVTYKAKDILRASGLTLLEEYNKHVKAALTKVRAGTLLSPILLIRGRTPGHPLLVADGHHRVCASYHLDENSEIPCYIVDPVEAL
jgi:hypothetical protein